VHTTYFEALSIPLADGFRLRLEDEARRARGKGRDYPAELADDWRAVPSERLPGADKPNDRPPFVHDVAAPERGLNALRLFELRDYAWEIERDGAGPFPELTITSSLGESEERRRWRGAGLHGRFQFVNFLGSAWIEVRADGVLLKRVSFDVASPKLDYEKEYRAMVEAIGKQCQQLLLEWGAPTALSFSSDPVKQKQTLLEQFLFLRHVLGPERIELYLETIQRRPHSRLQVEQQWKPSGAANPALFVRDPLRHGRGWHRNGAGIVAEEIREERKFDSLDTPPNRFLKFALQSFQNVCDEVLSSARHPDDTVALEAASLRHSLDAFLSMPLFDDVGELRRIPFESTILQRREGYREILHAWLMLDAAAQIDWPGREDAYDGTTRDVATLYEYWLYFIMVKAFRDDLKMVPERDPLAAVDGAVPFCCHADDGRLLIHLKQREPSFCRFRWSDGERHLRVHFFYNRSFGRKGIGERGSYSKTFRPDYTLVIIPEEFGQSEWHTAEQAAEQAGRIAYLHFDAKYRGENLRGIFGEADSETDDPEENRAAGTVKNVDLYKMHTYNEAIRRTAGSYVLYPGDAAADGDRSAKSRFQRYHELVPGIGAFALRPRGDSKRPDGLQAVVDFIKDILTHHLTQFSQSYRIDYWTESTVREDRVEYNIGSSALRLGNRPPKDTQVLLGFVRGEDAALDCRNTLTFFCHAVEWKPDGFGKPGEATDLQFDPFRSDFFVAYYRRQTAGWVAKVKETRLVTAEERATEIGRPLTDMRAAYYYRFQLEDIQEMHPHDVSGLVAARPGKPRACRASEFALCPSITIPAR
jgi:predicted component of viral defense system (DUF524 family)